MQVLINIYGVKELNRFLCTLTQTNVRNTKHGGQPPEAVQMTTQGINPPHACDLFSVCLSAWLRQGAYWRCLMLSPVANLTDGGRGIDPAALAGECPSDQIFPKKAPPLVSFDSPTTHRGNMLLI